MREQQRRISGRPQVQQKTAAPQTAVTAQPVSTFVQPNVNNSLSSLGPALERFSPGLQHLLEGYYIEDAQEKLAQGELEGMTGQTPSGDAGQFELHAYNKAKTIRKAIDGVRAGEDEARNIRVDDPETWGSYKSPEEATKGMLQTRMMEAVQGVDPKFAPYIVHTFDRAMDGIIEGKRKEHLKFSAQDLADSVSTITHETLSEEVQAGNTSPEAMRGVFDRMQVLLTADGLLTKKEASEILANQFGQFAIDNKNPDVLSFIDVKDKDGIALAQTSAGDQLRRDLGAASKARDSEFNMGKITMRALVSDKARNGILDPAEILAITKEMPDLHTNEEWGTLLAQSIKKQAEGEVVNEAYNAIGQGQGFMVEDGTEKKNAVRQWMSEIETQGLEQGLSPEEIFARQVNLLNDNGAMVDPALKSQIENGAAIIPSDLNAPMPDGFKNAVVKFNKMYSVNPTLALRHVSHQGDAHKNILRFNAWTMAGRSEEEAWARLRQVADQPMLEQNEFIMKGMQQQLDNAINDLDTVELDAIKNNGAVYGIFKNMATRYAELGLGAEQAIEGAKNFVNMYYKQVGSRAVFTGGQELPPDFEKFNEWYIKEIVKRDPDEYYVMPDGMRGGGLMHVVGDFSYTPDKAFLFKDAYRQYMETKGMKVSEANDVRMQRLLEEKAPRSLKDFSKPGAGAPQKEFLQNIFNSAKEKLKDFQ